MAQSLESLRSNLAQLAKEHGIGVFYGLSRLMDNLPIVHWDGARHPNVSEFLEIASKLAIPVLVVHERQFLPEHIEDALEQLEDAELDPSERKDLDARIRNLSLHLGEICLVEASFDYNGRVYMYTAETDWYEQLTDLLDEIESSYQNDDPGNGLGGYFSRN